MESKVEHAYLERTGQKLQHRGSEKTGVIVVENFPSLGRLAALRFLEWVQRNPEGVVSLPTGKTPEYFIREVTHMLENWQTPEVQEAAEASGLDPSAKPEPRGLRFVQIDEFYPINPRQHNSFYYYVEKFYLEGFGMDPNRALLINCEKIGLPAGRSLEDVWGEDSVDLSLRYRHPTTERERMQQEVIGRVDQWCVEYEEAIRDMGGIGFFLGGIGPDGHIGFNVRGSSMYSTTRLADTNYETQAAAATDLGGIEVSRKRRVITIGLATITYNRNCVAVIIAAGDAKAHIVADSIQHEQTIHYPATALQDLKNSRFYVTEGAAKHLTQRNLLAFEAQEEVSDFDIEKTVADVAIARGRRIVDLTEADYKKHEFGKELLKKAKRPVRELNKLAEERLKAKIQTGITIRKNKQFLHTEPHHDDIMLGYLPFVVRHIREHSNQHYFATMTSGFTSVTNAYMLNVSRRMKQALDTDEFSFRELLEDGYFDPDNRSFRDHDVWRYLDGLASRSEELKEDGTLRRFFRDLIVIYDESDMDNIRHRVDELINYFETQYPGKKDLPYIQTLKGMCREWESACLWGYFGWNSSAIEHLRLGFYTGDIFTEEPTINRDVVPVLDLMRKVRPDVVTVALDPEASGPDTHYKVLQAVSEGLRSYEEETGNQDIEVIGYRNVWYRFHPAEAEILVPVSLNMMTLQHSSFMNTYISQKNASFPSYEFNGPFSLLAQKIQVEQYEAVATCLGREYFYEHPSALIRATRGFVFLRSLTLEQFYQHSRQLRQQAENR
jgi:glucosamine-6-phosphate deaminase